MKNNKLPILLIAISFISCKDFIRNETPDILSEHKSTKISLIDNPMKPVQVNDVIASDYDDYMEMFVPTNYTIAVKSARNPFLDGEIISTSIINNSRYYDDKDIDFYVNGMRIESNTYSKAGTKSADFDSIYGRLAKFSMSNGVHTKSNNEEYSLYIPETIRISSPKIEAKEDEYPLCDYSSFVLRWNADLKNEKGVVLIVMWNGLMVVGESYSDTYVQRIDVVPDNGEITINPHMFDDIPDTAICKLIIGRGNVEVIQKEEVSYKFFGESHEVIPFILVRNIDY